MHELVSTLDALDKVEVQAKGRIVDLMRATGASWPEMERATGKPHSTLRFWHQRYLESPSGGQKHPQAD